MLDFCFRSEIDAKLSETEENVQSIEKKRLKEETDMESKREQLKVDKMKIEQLKSDYVSDSSICREVFSSSASLAGVTSRESHKSPVSVGQI